MKKTLSLVFVFVLIFGLLTCLSNLAVAQQAPVGPPQISLQVTASGFILPVDITHAGDDRLFVVEQDGRIRIMDTSGTVNPIPFLDINARVGSAGSEQGLLGLAFPPTYSTDGRFYVNYTGNDGDTRISRFSVTADPDVADPASEEILLLLDQPYSNHNGGCLKFGPDSMLYIGMGDGGWFGDPGNRSQSRTSLLGKMLRLDVRGSTGYAIPSDNPYVTDPDTLPEIWHFGLRNPWRFSFDRALGDLWIGDVGQNLWEEINFQPASSAGGENWGWRCYEGQAVYNTVGCSADSAYDDPVYVYSHATAGFSVTGGFVYRASLQNNLQGHYLFADYVTGRWWTIQRDPCNDSLLVHPLGIIQSDISTFGESSDGELFCANLATGQIYRVLEDCSGVSYTLEEILANMETAIYWLEGYPEGSYSWYVNDPDFCNPLPGNTDSTFATPPAGGVLYVDITNAEGCTIRVGPMEIILYIGLAAQPDASSWKIYPQPASDLLVWEGIPGPRDGVLRFVDVFGQTWDSKSLQANANTVRVALNTSRWPAGTYFAVWQSENSAASRPVIILR